MKILAIRGANLASLEGEFDLRFDEGPLGHAGVFAICGPTGAGKSTLLDAMCLALFDTAPRLDGGGRGRVGLDAGERLTQRDPRSLLRKGVAEGFAEVEFLGVDGRRYASRWEVRRARGDADGKLQPVRMALRDLEDEWSESGRKTDVKSAIEERLGLTFDQFRRSVLLAQGDFAAFLDADPRERAELFERMTGTEIYSLISREAHRRAARERERVALLETRHEAIGALDADERAGLEAREASLSSRVRQDELAALDAAAAVRWHHHREALQSEERESVEAQTALDDQLELVETQRAQLAAIEKAAPLRPALTRMEVAERVVLERQAIWQQAVRRAAGASASALELAEATASAEARGAALEAAAESARGALARCDTLEVQRATAEYGQREADAAARDARAQADALRTRTRKDAEALERVRTQLVEVRDHLAAAAPHASLEGDGERAVERLERLFERRAALAEARTTGAQLTSALNAAQARVAEADGSLAGYRFRRGELEVRYRAARDEARKAPPETLESLRAEWLSQRTALERLIGLADRAEASHEAHRRHATLAQECRAAAAVAGAARLEAEAERARLDVRAEECAASRDRLRARLDLRSHRDELVEGEACPLCGATEHPFAGEALGNELLEEIDERMRELSSERSAADRRGADLGREVAAQEAAAARAEAERDLHAAALASARAEYETTAEALASETSQVEGQATRPSSWPRRLPESPAAAAAPAEGDRDWGPLFELARVEEGGALLGEGARAALQVARDEATQALTRLSTRVADRREIVRVVVELRESCELARGAEEKAAGDARRVARDLEERRAERETHHREELRLESEVSSLRAGLADALRGLPAAQLEAAGLSEERSEPRIAHSEAAGSKLIEVVRATLLRLAGWRAEDTRLRALERAQAPELAALEARLEAADERAARAVRAAEERRKVAVALAAEAGRARADALSHLPESLAASAADGSKTLGDQLRAALREAREELDRSRALSQRAAVDEAQAMSRLEASAEGLADAERSWRLSVDVLHAQLAPLEMDEAVVRALLSHDATELDGWRAEITRLDRARREQLAVVLERRRKREAHEAAEAPRLDSAAAAAAQSETEARLASTRELFHSVRSRIDRDDQDQRRASETKKALEAQRARLSVWDTLSDVIGSASGNKLRVFVQSLTLELLLGHANAQLRQLAPRYSLSRVPGEDLALQVVDHEMGDEVRALSSLSGGESFLVALGLALGLASLTSERARIDSLFIDEGFGALDPESLEMVLATLDTLQASGRQVGLISHVPAIAERFEARIHVVPRGPATSRVSLG